MSEKEPAWLQYASDSMRQDYFARQNARQNAPSSTDTSKPPQPSQAYTQQTMFGGGLLGGVARGVQDIFEGGSQLLAHSLPDGVVNAINRANNAIPFFDKLPEVGGAKSIDTAIAQGEKAYQADRERAGRGEGVDWARMSGNIGGTLAVPIGTPSTLMKAAKVGAGMSALTPEIMPENQTDQDNGVLSDYFAQKLPHMAVGAAMGGAGAGIFNNVLPAVKASFEPFTRSGQEAITAKALVNASGGDWQALQRNLESFNPSVHGVQNTVAEAANIPSLAALQRSAMATNPTVLNALAQRQLDNNAARIQAIEGAIPNREQALLDRNAQAEQLYGQAYGKGVTMTPELVAILERESMKGAKTNANKLLSEKGVQSPFNEQGQLTGESAHYLKMGLDDYIRGLSGEGGMGSHMERAAIDTRNAYLQQLENQIPEYAQARLAYAEGSKPINQADILTAIKELSTRNTQGNMTPAAFNRVASDKTAQAITRQPTTTLDAVLTPEQMQAVNAVREDLRRLDFANNAGRGSGSDTAQKLAYDNMIREAGVPNFVINSALPQGVGSIASRISDLAYANANRELSARLANAMLDPAEATRLLQQHAPSMIGEQLKQGVTIGSGLLGSGFASSNVGK